MTVTVEEAMASLDPKLRKKLGTGVGVTMSINQHLVMA